MIELITLGILDIAAVIVGVAAIIAVTRIVKGPSALDRVVATDLIVAVIIVGLGIWTAFVGQPNIIMFLLLLSLLGFTSATSIARLVGDRVAHGKRPVHPREVKP